ncbi:MAG: HypC/HybG/HupF family hydrogenase formation chaperone [Thermodesulfovibrionales bacterium]|nr:HypC/HybG/HupF family hydrogenase formation chaperone [Thermodesulfovibrionales bacterium]
MCLAIPSKILKINSLMAMVEAYGGAQKEISLMLLPDEPSVGDYVLVHAGFAIQTIDSESAEESHRFLTELLLSMAEEGT